VASQLHALPEAAQAKVQDLLQRTGRILNESALNNAQAIDLIRVSSA
jgi:hypothetical protein